jgi:hypothetical protein
LPASSITLPSAFSVATSINGTDYTTRGTNSSLVRMEGWQSVSFAAVSARYVRISVTHAGAGL